MRFLSFTLTLLQLYTQILYWFPKPASTAHQLAKEFLYCRRSQEEHEQQLLPFTGSA